MILALSLLLARPALPGAQFRAGVAMVEVYASVTGPDGRAVRDLTRDDFTVLEDERPQTVETFAAGDFPAAVALAIDRSLSMRGAPLTMARTAGRVFLAQLDPDDQAMLIGIGGQVEVLAPLSVERQPLLEALATLDPWSTTALHDAMIEAIDLVEPGTGRRAVVIISDGEDRYSRATEEQALDRVRRSDVMVYPIAVGKMRPRLFVEAAALSGGQSYHLTDPRQLVSTLEAIANDLGSQYLLGYQPSRPWPEAGSEWRSITVKVDRPGLRIRARGGYATR
ncbi:MAG: VWA domain-containing protein [Vicinamibacterales bacterium]